MRALQSLGTWLFLEGSKLSSTHSGVKSISVISPFDPKRLAFR